MNQLKQCDLHRVAGGMDPAQITADILEALSSGKPWVLVHKNNSWVYFFPQ